MIEMRHREQLAAVDRRQQEARDLQAGRIRAYGIAQGILPKEEPEMYRQGKDGRPEYVDPTAPEPESRTIEGQSPFEAGKRAAVQAAASQAPHSAKEVRENKLEVPPEMRESDPDATVRRFLQEGTSKADNPRSQARNSRHEGQGTFPQQGGKRFLIT